MADVLDRVGHARDLRSDPKAKILLVDDNPSNLLVLRTILEDLGSTLVEAHSGEEALQHVRDGEFAVILLDVLMPGLSGFETAKSVRADLRASRTPIIFVTANDIDRQLLEEGYELGAVDFLTKPLSPIVIRAKVRGFVELFEEKIRASREAEQLRLLVQGTTDYAIFMLDPEGYIVTWNTGAERFKGYKAEEIIGEHFSRFYPPDAIARNWPSHELEVAQSDGRFEDEGWRVRKDGSLFWANVVLTALWDDRGVLQGFSKITRDMTERNKAAENARRLADETTARQVAEDTARVIQEQRERLRVTLASIGDGVISTDSAGQVEYLNPVAEELVGWTNAEAAGKYLTDVFNIVNETTRQAVDNPAIRALQEGRIVGLANHTILITKDGTERPIDDSAAPIRLNDGQILGSVLVFRDITDRKINEQKINEARSRLESTLAAGDIGTWEFDVLNNVVRADANLARMFSVTLEEAAGGSLEAYVRAIHEEDRDRVTQRLRSALASDDSYELEYRVRGAEGSFRWVVARGRVERDEEGKAVRSPGVVIDITARKTIERQLRASEDRRMLALSSAELGAWHLDPIHYTLSTDERFQFIFNGRIGPVSFEQAVGNIHPDDQTRVRNAVAAAMRPEDPAPYAEEYRVIHEGTKTIRWVLAKGRANFEGTGADRTLVSFDGTLADITDRKRMENDLRQLAANLSEADHRKDEFLATLAHELRNPLAPIRNGLQLMRLASDDKKVIFETRTMMERQLAQLIRLVDDLMDVSRISQGKLQLRTERIDLAAAINSAVETSRSLISEMGHELTMTLPSQPIYIDGDLTRLAQVFMNLLNNAAKYSEPNGHIWLTVELTRGEVTISITDQGIGIAADQLPHVFELFSQIDRSLEKSQGGLGIGLSLVKRLVEMHGGSIEARSEGAGFGSVFIVRLPVVEQGVEPISITSEDPIAQKSGLRILIVDDNFDSADSLALMLKSLGNETRTAYDGEQAVVTAAEMHPDVILLDIGLPKLNGHEVCLRIRQQPGGDKIVIIAQTGWGQDEDRQLTSNAGFDDHMVKPIDPRALMKLLSAL